MTMPKTVLMLLIVFAAVISTQGCATHDRRDAPWDPRGGASLLDQIPNWDGEAQRRCGGHLPESERGTRSSRC